MSRIIGAICLAIAMFAAAAAAQNQTTEKSFDLKHAKFDTTAGQPAEQEIRPISRPRLRAGALGASVTLGFIDLSGTLLEHDQIIYKVNEAHTYWGDVQLKGQSAFNPILRVDYQLKPWLALEAAFGISVSEYTSEITRRVRTSNDIASDEVLDNPELGEFDAEERSLVTLNTGLAGVVYPLDLLHAGHAEAWSSRWHPFVLVGGGQTWFSLNSDYTDQMASSMSFCAGGGLRFIADRLVSLRVEVLYNRATIDLEPAEKFREFNDGTLVIPIMERISGQAPRRVEDFTSQTVGALSWAIGFTAAF